MISGCTVDRRAMGCCSSIWRCAGLLTYCLTTNPQRWQLGYVNTQGPKSWRVIAVSASEMESVGARPMQSRLLIDSIFCATSWMHLINSNDSAAPPVAPLSAMGFALHQLTSLIRRRYRTRHPSPSPVSGGVRTELDLTSGNTRERCELRAGRSWPSAANSVYRRRPCGGC